MKALELLPALGKRRSSSEVRATLARLGEHGDFHGEHPRGYGEFRALGICVVFDVEQGQDAMPASWTTLSIMFFGTREDEYKAFQGELPEGLAFGEKECWQGPLKSVQVDVESSSHFEGGFSHEEAAQS